jgi:transcriptional regulator with XRE-family HTH domain
LRINLTDLSDDYRIALNKDYRELLFKKILDNTSLKKFAEKMGTSPSYLYHLKNGRYRIGAKSLVRICRYIHEPISNLIDNLDGFYSNRGGKIKPKLPPYASSSVASLIGHCFGDASIHKKRTYFSYANKDLSLVRDVENRVNAIFGITPLTKQLQKDRTYRVVYSTLVGNILLKFGAPWGNKVEEIPRIPTWIYQGKKEIKRNFLRSLFDDDGSVLFTRHHKSKNINLHLTRIEELQTNLFDFFNKIREMLREFGVEAQKPRIDRKYISKDRKRVVVYTSIYDHHSLVNFCRGIGFRQTERARKLRELVMREQVYNKYDIERDMDIIRLELSDKSLSTAQIADKLGCDAKKTLKRLKKLRGESKIDIIEKVANNRSYIWVGYPGGEGLAKEK